MKFLRRYLILCGVLFNLGLVAVLVIDATSGKHMIRTGVDWVVKQITTDHPSIAGLVVWLHSKQDSSPVIIPPPEEAPFKPVPVLIDKHIAYPSGRILHVGPGEILDSPDAASKVAKDGDTILFKSGIYRGGTAIWRANDLTLRGDGGMAIINAKGIGLPQDKAIWVMQGDRIRVENIEFTGAKSPDKNGAGIRAEGSGLHVINCYFHHNQEGILSGSNPDSEIIIEHSEFAYNGHPGGQSHNLYVGAIKRLIFRFNYVHHAIIGSNVKTRAHENHILYNKIMDYSDGRVNYGIDISNGGIAYVIGNIIQQGPLTENYHLLTFAPEGAKYPEQELYVVHNTFVNNRQSGQFIRNTSGAIAHVYNNIFSGAGGIITGEAILAGNLVERDKSLVDNILHPFSTDESLDGMQGSSNNRIVPDVGFVNQDRYDYHLRPGSPAIHAGVKLEAVNGVDLNPSFEYRHPRSGTPRQDSGLPDIGAYQ